MRGIVIEEFNKPYVYRTDIPTPKPKPGEMLIKMKAAGFCHTELMAAKGDFNSALPMVPGHENVGVICEIGSDVKGDFKIGDRVGVGIFRDLCGKCRECLRGSTNYCISNTLSGLTIGGGMAEYMVADPLWTVKLPDDMPFEVAAPLMCAGSTMYNSIQRAKMPTGSIVAIIGLGGLGHLGVQFAKVMGYKVVAIDTRDEPLALMSTLPPRLQPDLVLNAKSGVPAALEAISTAFSSSTVPSLRATGVDFALVSTDALPAFAFATDIIEKHGTLVVVGQPEKPIPMPYSVFISTDLVVIAGCLGQPSTNSEMLATVQREGIHVERRAYELSDVGKLIKDYHDPGMKGKLIFKIED
ncbi:chaperonin 10-like protein [Ilyonectria sp. MPI-CAGE-AT-0026]|nr:chaperonin 10-like protein [Ilyonectria sp. MPI-CAGE-AT-0026]